METEKVYAMDKQTPGAGENKNIKFIAKSYKPDGNIIYYEDNEVEDGFSEIIKDLKNGNDTSLFFSKDKIKATLDFIEELKFSVENAKLKLIFKQNNTTEEIIFTF